MSRASETVQIRSMTANELTAIVEIERAAKPHPWSEAMLRKETEVGPISRPRVAVVKGRIAGFIMAWFVADEVHIINIVVHPEFQRRGIATRLMEHVFDEARNRGYEKVYLEVRESNQPAIRLYHKLGFREAGIRPQYYEDTGEDALLMVKKIDQRASRS